eukprot:GHVQ01022383.1.p2 GENE.GHVQ01022383.1~~GHVQ01022383.1.p2  ORF type:complete len:115 (+),score=5.00 GHVQ01022383.1:264-608(+)
MIPEQMPTNLLCEQFLGRLWEISAIPLAALSAKRFLQPTQDVLRSASQKMWRCKASLKGSVTWLFHVTLFRERGTIRTDCVASGMHQRMPWTGGTPFAGLEFHEVQWTVVAQWQ